MTSPGGGNIGLGAFTGTDQTSGTLNMYLGYATGEVQTVQYQKVNAMLLNEVQEQHRQIGGQQAEIDEIKARVAAIERPLGSDRK